MKIIVFGAAGTAGQRITSEAATRGHEVIPVVRETGRTASVSGISTVAGDATSQQSILDLALGADAVVLAVGNLTDEGIYLDAARAATEALRALAQDERPYLLHMGGGASLTLPDGTAFMDLPGFPEAFLVPARGQAAALAHYRSVLDISWTYLSPPPVHFFLGERTGAYRTGIDEPVADDSGQARVSYEDFAVAVIDELEHPHFTGRRFTLGY